MKRFVPYLVLLLLACETTIDIDPDTGFEIFTIGAGQHSSINKNEVFSGDGIEFKVIFDESAEYISQDDNNQGDINNLTWIFSMWGTPSKRKCENRMEMV